MGSAVSAATQEGLESWTAASASASSDDGGIAVAEEGLHAFELISKVGTGAFGTVWKARRRVTGEVVALKIQDKEQVLQQGRSDRVMAERKIMTKMSHPFIVRLLSAFQDHEKLFLELTFASGGDLYAALARRPAGRFDEGRARFYTAEMVLALGHLHSHGIVFRDLKPENALLGGDGHILLTDFGLATQHKRALSSSDLLAAAEGGALTGAALSARGGSSSSVCGTPEFMAPEQWDRDAAVGPAADVWALGCCVYLMLGGKTPFQEDRLPGRVSRERASAATYAPLVGDDISDLARACVAAMVVLEPERRPTMDPADCARRVAWFADVDWAAILAKRIDPPEKDPLHDEDDDEDGDDRDGPRHRAERELTQFDEALDQLTGSAPPSLPNSPIQAAGPPRHLTAARARARARAGSPLDDDDTLGDNHQEDGASDRDAPARHHFPASSSDGGDLGGGAALLELGPLQTTQQHQHQHQQAARLSPRSTAGRMVTPRRRGPSPVPSPTMRHRPFRYPVPATIPDENDEQKFLRRRRSAATGDDDDGDDDDAGGGKATATVTATLTVTATATATARRGSTTSPRSPSMIPEMMMMKNDPPDAGGNNNNKAAARVRTVSLPEVSMMAMIERGDPEAGVRVMSAYLESVAAAANVGEERRCAVETWCALRSVGCCDRSVWTRLASEDLVYTHPMTPYRHEEYHEVSACGTMKILNGVDEFLEDIGAAETTWNKDDVRLTKTTVRGALGAISRSSSSSDRESLDGGDDGVFGGDDGGGGSGEHDHHDAEERKDQLGELVGALESSSSSSSSSPRTRKKSRRSSKQNKSTLNIEPFKNIVLVYELGADDIVVSPDGAHAAFVCTLREVTRSVTTLVMGEVSFQVDGRIATMVITLDVLGFARLVAERDRRPTASPMAAAAAAGGSSEEAAAEGGAPADGPAPPAAIPAFFHSYVRGASDLDEPQNASDLGYAAPTGPADYDFVRKLREGTFGRVWLARERGSRLSVAVKAAAKPFLQETGLWRRVVTESVVLAAVDHPFINRLFATFHDDAQVYLVLELLEGRSLADVVNAHHRKTRASSSSSLSSSSGGALGERAVRHVMGQVFDGLAHLHAQSVAYRALEPKNVFLNARGDAVLIDFASVGVRGALGRQCAALLGDHRATSSPRSSPKQGGGGDDDDDDAGLVFSTFCGAPDFAAPEILRGAQYDETVDFWALGVVLYILLVGTHPFAAANASTTGQGEKAAASNSLGDGFMRRILRGSAPNMVPEAIAASVAARDLVVSLLSPAERRPGAEAIRAHGFFRSIDWDALRALEVDPPAEILNVLLTAAATTTPSSPSSSSDHHHHHHQQQREMTSTGGEEGGDPQPSPYARRRFGRGGADEGARGAMSVAPSSSRFSSSSSEGADEKGEGALPSRVLDLHLEGGEEEAKNPEVAVVSFEANKPHPAAVSFGDYDLDGLAEVGKPALLRARLTRRTFLEMRQTRTLHKYFALKTRCCAELDEWSTVLDPHCVQSQPACPYRPQFCGRASAAAASSSAAAATQQQQQQQQQTASSPRRVFLIGVDDILRDMRLAATGGDEPGAYVSGLDFALVSTIHDDDGVANFFKWTISSPAHGVTILGAGRARFAASGLIRTLDIVHDVNGFIAKLIEADPTLFAANPVLRDDRLRKFIQNDDDDNLKYVRTPRLGFTEEEENSDDVCLVDVPLAPSPRRIKVAADATKKGIRLHSRSFDVADRGYDAVCDGDIYAIRRVTADRIQNVRCIQPGSIRRSSAM